MSAFVLRMPAYFNPIVDEDEAFYAVAANVMNSDGLIYKDVVDLKPPLLFYIYAGMFAVFGNDMCVMHLNTTFWVLFTAFFIYKATALLSNRRSAYLAALLYVVFSLTFIPKALATNAEILMNLPSACAVYTLLKAEKTSQGLLYLLSGILCGLATLIKYQAGIALPVMLGYLLVIKPLFVGKVVLRKVIVNCLWILLGFCVVFLALFAGFSKLGNWDDFYFWGWKFNFQYMSGMNWGYFVKRFFGITPRFVLIWIVLWITATVRIRAVLKAGASRHLGEYLMVFWLLGSGLAVCVGGKFFGHYYVQVLPPLVTLFGIGTTQILEASRRLWLRRFVLVLIVMGVIGPALTYFVYNWKKEQERMRGENQRYEQIAQSIKSKVPPQEKVFVWGRVPEIYYFSGRLPASRFVSCTFLVGMTAYNYHDPETDANKSIPHQAWSLLIDDLRRNRPYAIVDTAVRGFREFGKYPIPSYPELRGLIEEDYSLDRTSELRGVYFLKSSY